MIISIYNNAFDNTGTTIDMDEFLEMIGLGEWMDTVEKIRNASAKERDELKKLLPCVTFSGRFSVRLDGSIVEYNGFYIIDFDKLEAKELNRLRLSLESDPFVYSVFVSTSGNGLKAIFKSSNTDPLLHKPKFKSLSDYIEKVHKAKPDPSGCNISRLCFASYDPVVYYNPQVEAIDLEITGPARHRDWSSTAVDKAKREGAIETNAIVIFAKIKGFVEEKGVRFKKGMRHHYLLRMACALNRAGLTENMIRKMINDNHSLDDEMSKDLERILQSVREQYAGEFFTRPLWAKKRNSTLGLDLTDLH